MQPAPPAALQLSQRLRQLRQQRPRLTQRMLAEAFSAEESVSAATVSSWESSTSPKLPPPYRLEAYARFFCTPRSTAESAKLYQAAELTPDERQAYEKIRTELERLRRATNGESADSGQTFNRTWHFSDGARVTFVCAKLPADEIGPFGDSSSPNYTELQTYADIDALVELFGHVRAENPTATVRFRTPPEVEPDELVGHLILLGGVVWNEITETLSEMAHLPVKQITDAELASGDIFVAEVDGVDKQFWPKWTDESEATLAADVGLLARVPNPLNASRTLTICNGIHSRGVYGAVRSLTDAEMREGNERYISTQFGDAKSFAILASVKVIRKKAMTPDFHSPDVILYRWPDAA
jgi:Helix-turn-helix domain